MTTYLSPAAYLPHEAPMLLLEQVVDVTASGAHCRVTVSPDGVLRPFLDPHGHLPGWYALELMAQTIGVWSGWHRQQQGEPLIDLGMVLGARELVCESGLMAAGARLDITVERLIQDPRFGSFESVIQVAGQPVASGRINTFQPTAEELTALFNQGAPL